MYIPEFVCGIFATIIVEIVLAVVCALISTKKKHK